MMDIIDIMLAKAMTPQGKTDTYVGKAAAAARKAEQAKQDALAAIASVDAAAEDIADKKDAADALLASAQDALEIAQAAQINMPEVYTTTGQNTDGYMTQKAVTDALASKANSADITSALSAKADVSALLTKADKTYVDQQIASIPTNGGSGSGVSNLGSENAGHIVVVGETGNIIAGDTTESAIVESLLRSGIFQAKQAVGLDINYQDKEFTRTQDAVNLNMGIDFDQFAMYGGRIRCNVSDNGTITAFYGDNNYADDGSNGMVMVYQPKFYYQRIPLKVDIAAQGSIVRHESIIVSAEKQAGLKVHPLFDAGNGEEYDYVLLPAYEGSITNNKLQSIAGVKPASNISIADAEVSAQARGTGWHIMNMQAISANQMLEIVEFGTMNGQTALEAGISNLYYTNGVNCAAITGSTSILGNASGHATTTISDNNGTEITNTTAGTRAISYRGMENPWGNMWQMIGGINIKGDGNSQGGQPYICVDFNYTPALFGSNYEYVGFNLPSTYGWISAMGYGDEKYDWVLLPIECASSANSALPVGDNLWTVSGLNTNKVVSVGGTYGFKESDGPFYYACDVGPGDTARHNANARLMYIPTKGAIYEANIAKWNTYMGG